MHVKMDYKLREEETTLISPHLCMNLDILLHFVLLTVIYFYGLFRQRETISTDLSSHLWKTLILIEWKHVKQVPFHIRNFSLNYGNAEQEK